MLARGLSHGSLRFASTCAEDSQPSASIAGRRMAMNPMRLLTTFVLSFLCFVALPASAHAGPSASGSISTKGARGSSSGGGYDWPDLVYGGNAISFLAPFQIGAVGYLPKGRFAFQY